MKRASVFGGGRVAAALTGCRRLARERRGATLVEFAIVCAPFLALLMAALQTALIYFGQEALETAVEASARTVITGTAQANDATGTAQGMTQAQLQARFKQAACASLPTFMSCNRVLVDVQSAPTFSSINTTVPTITFDQNGNVTNQFNYNLGSAGSIAMIRLMYIWPIEMAPMGVSLGNMGSSQNGNSGKRLMVATSVAKVEAYTS